MLADESLERLSLAFAGSVADPGGDHVHDRHPRIEAVSEVASHAQRQLGVRSPADRYEDRAHGLQAALLDDGDVAWGLADHRVDGRGEDRREVGPSLELLWGGDRAGRRRRAFLGERRGAGAGRRATPAEDEQVGALLGDGLDDAFRRPPTDAHHRPDLDALFVAEGEDALQQPAGGAGRGRALGERVLLGHLDDAEGGDLRLPSHSDARTDSHEVARRPGIGEGQQDPVWLALASRHQRSSGDPLPSAPDPMDRQRPTRYGLSSSNSSAWFSIARSAWSVVSSSVSLMKPAVRPK